MAEQLPINFPVPQESAIASYPYFDVSEGTGKVAYYGTSVYDGSAHVYKLVTNTNLYSSQDGTTDTAVDVDFDVTFNTPKIVNGVVVFQVPGTVGGSGADPVLTIKGTLIHYDGSTETTIGSQITLPTLGTTGGSFIDGIRVGTWTISNQKFKSGETLRLNIVATRTGGTTGRIAHSPVDQVTGFDVSSQLILLVPFKLDL